MTSVFHKCCIYLLVVVCTSACVCLLSWCRMLYVVTPIYVGEVTREDVRGRFLAAFSAWTTAGFTVSYTFILWKRKGSKKVGV